ncbi:hypothetical protein A1Q1_05001 [Trichosporon asahii var. asahii CBS 2479]|nr:hypothetical protein A1Q1_05001 [Trichosporon asahii var. asahii CBS 2479]EJT46354.1 hypothetical protein A1Q1_05001 [Trichosporon asahii var. asahii CBS 2479]
MSADQSLYHLEPEGFWKKFHDAVVVNPKISSGLPLPLKNRYPPPASRPERYATPATKASDVAFNPYYKRDTRRAYPQTSVVTQAELSALLIAGPAQAALPSGTTSTELTESNTPDLTVAIAAIPQNSFVAAGINTGKTAGLPPTPPPANPKGKWQPKQGEYIPRFKHQYFPIENYV